MKEPLKSVKLLNHGFVELWDKMGDDSTIADAARTSYADATKRSNNRNLIRYMWRHLHTSPFEQVVFQFRLKMPIFVARQWIRHRTARLNEWSGRYSEMPEEYYDYSLQGLPLQSTTNNQGSEDEQVRNVDLELNALNIHIQEGFDRYRSLLEIGCSKEIARCHLPLSTYTVFVWQMDLKNLLHFIGLRADKHAQAEIRVYAEAIYDMIKEYVPFACEAFEDYSACNMNLSRMEQAALMEILQHKTPDLKAHGLSKREEIEFVEKINQLGVEYRI